jgi:hypothetical protein
MDNGLNESDSGQTAKDLYHIVVVPSHGYPECLSFNSKEDFVEKLRSYNGKRVSCHVFYGERMHISLPPRKLINSDGQVEADLSYEPKSTELDPNGSMFDDMEVFDDDDEYFKS